MALRAHFALFRLNRISANWRVLQPDRFGGGFAACDVDLHRREVRALTHDPSAIFVVMGQMHHELDAPDALMVECKRLLKAGGTLAIIDWADADNGKSAPVGRRVPVRAMRALHQAVIGSC